jgi:hypothetical protein
MIVDEHLLCSDCVRAVSRHVDPRAVAHDKKSVSGVGGTIGRLDRCLSELEVLAQDPSLDEADRQTIKHHAEDCIDLCKRVLETMITMAMREWRDGKP